MERGLTKTQLIAELSNSPHGDLSKYNPGCAEHAKQDPDFFAHLISWSARNGSVRDANIALPLVSLSVGKFDDPELLENSLAHLAKLSPRELAYAYEWSAKTAYVQEVVKGFVVRKDKDGKEVKAETKQRKYFPRPGFHLGSINRRGLLRRMIERYLRVRESDIGELETNIVNFRRSMAWLYKNVKINPSEEAKSMLYDRKYGCGSRLEAVSRLHLLGPKEAAAAILDNNIPFLLVQGALKKKAKDKLVVMAMIERMTPSQVQTSLSMLERFGVKDYPETRAALEEALGKLAKSGKTTFKTGVASKHIKDKAMREKVAEVAEKQIENVKTMKGVDGDWIVLVDRSGSMTQAIEVGKMVAAALAKMVKGRVSMIFFDTAPTYYDVTGKTYEEIQEITKRIRPGGSTSIGCGLLAAIERKVPFDGIAVVSDGGENASPYFHQYYKVVEKTTGQSPVIYFYKLGGDQDRFSGFLDGEGIYHQDFDLRGKFVDYYSVMNLAQTMNKRRYSLIDAIMDTPLLTLDEVFGTNLRKEVAV